MLHAQGKCILVALLGICVGSAFADDNAITPYRPSVSSPAQLPVSGQLEFELGGQHTKIGQVRRDSLPYLFKLGFSEEWGILLGGEAQVWQRDDVNVHGVGDTTITLKRAFIQSDTTAFGLELGAKVPTAKDSIGSGKADYTLNSIYSQDFANLHMDANLNATRLGAVEPGASRTQIGLSTAFSMPLSQRWSGIGEISGARRGGVPSTAQILAAVAYAPSKRLTIDFGFTKGLNSASQDWSIFSGFVVPVANLW
jgi:hypothetical protein